MILFDLAYVAESAKIGKCIISHIDDVNMCKNSRFCPFFDCGASNMYETSQEYSLNDSLRLCTCCWVSKNRKVHFSDIDDVNMCKNSLFLTLTGLKALVMHFDTKFNSLLWLCLSCWVSKNLELRYFVYWRRQYA